MHSHISLFVVTGCLIMVASVAQEPTTADNNIITTMLNMLTKGFLSAMIFDNKPECADATTKIVSHMATRLVPDVMFVASSPTCFGIVSPTTSTNQTEAQVTGADRKRSVETVRMSSTELKVERRDNDQNNIVINMAKMGVDMMLKQQFKEGDHCYQLTRRISDDLFTIAPEVMNMWSTLNCFGGNSTAPSDPSDTSSQAGIDLMRIFLKFLAP